MIWLDYTLGLSRQVMGTKTVGYIGPNILFNDVNVIM